jgi:phage terminase small subunit
MPVLPNQRHEAFAQALAKGKSASEAMTAAGYRTDRGNASRLTANDSIRQRVAELQAKGAEKAVVTIDSLAAELDEARGIAKTEKQPNAMVQATMGKAKLFGLIIDKTRHSGTVHVITLTAQDLDTLTEHELAALEAAYPVLEKLGLVGGAGGPTSETTH